MANPLPRACKSLNDLNVGDTLRLPYSISDSDVQKFAELSGDFNPAHFNEDYAKGTVFKTRIAHGMISVAKFSGIFGMDMPGLGAIWGRQNLTFLARIFSLRGAADGLSLVVPHGDPVYFTARPQIQVPSDRLC